MRPFFTLEAVFRFQKRYTVAPYVLKQDVLLGKTFKIRVGEIEKCVM